jgi:hypothetical protein
MIYRMPWIYVNSRPCTGGLTVDFGGLPDSRVEELQCLVLNSSIMGKPEEFVPASGIGTILQTRGGTMEWKRTLLPYMDT